jgi:hypothetical protein
LRKYLTEYLSHLEELLQSGKDIDYDDLERSHLIMIQFMQHERLIHFLVTILFTLGFFISLAIYLLGDLIMMLPLLILILGLLCPYIAHYYFLENSVQKMYHLHDEIHARRMKQKNSSTP